MELIIENILDLMHFGLVAAIASFFATRAATELSMKHKNEDRDLQEIKDINAIIAILIVIFETSILLLITIVLPEYEEWSKGKEKYLKSGRQSQPVPFVFFTLPVFQINFMQNYILNNGTYIVDTLLV